MSSPKDNTRIMDMMKEFNLFVNRPVSSSSVQPVPPKACPPQLDLDQSISGSSPKTKRARYSNTKMDPDYTRLLRELSERTAELKYAKATMSSLKATAFYEDPIQKKASLELQKDLDMCKIKLAAEKETNLVLSNQLKILDTAEDDRSSVYLEKFGRLDKENAKLITDLKSSREQIQKLHDDLEQAKAEKSSILKSSKKEIMQLKSELMLLEDDLQNCKKEQESNKKDLIERFESEKTVLKLELETEIQALESKLDSIKDSQDFIEATKSDVKNLLEKEKEVKRLQDENRKLRHNIENSILLREKLKALELDQAKSSQGKSCLIELQIELQAMQHKLAQWETLAEEQGEANISPSLVSTRLATLQKNEALLKEETGQLQAEVKSSKLALKKFASECDTLKKDLATVRNQLESSNYVARKMRKRQILLSNECESFKRLISSYESEITVDMDAVQRDRIAQLESLLQEYKEFSEQDCVQGTQSILLTSERVDIEAENERLKKEVADLKCKISDSGKKFQDPYRVIHCRTNPVAMAQEIKQIAIKKIKEENETLKAKLKVLRDSEPDINITERANAFLREEEDGISQDVQVLRDQRVKAEEKSKRLMEAFRRSSREFREMCYLLTGYKMDVLSPKKYRLSHIYAEAPDQHLLFEATDDGAVQLLETEYSTRLSHLVQEHLQRHNSMPAFLSSLTLELFNNQTSVLLRSIP